MNRVNGSAKGNAPYEAAFVVSLLIVLAVVVCCAAGCGAANASQDRDYKAIAAASIAVAAVTPDDTVPVGPSVKVKRSECQVCKGTGKVRSGDGLHVSECDNCVVETVGEVTARDTVSLVSAVLPRNCPDGKCNDLSMFSKGSKTKSVNSTANCGSCSSGSGSSRRIFPLFRGRLRR